MAIASAHTHLAGIRLVPPSPMHAEAELRIGNALKRQWSALSRRGAKLARERTRRHSALGAQRDSIVFEQLIEGCLFTLCYSAGLQPALGVLDSKLTDHRLN